MWSRRRALAAGGRLAVLLATGSLFTTGAGPGAPRSAVSPTEGFEPPPPVDAAAARAAGWTLVTDFGAVGDGCSRPLGTRYRDLESARADFPGATDLAAELDGVAIQAAIDSGTQRVYYPPGRYLHDAALVVRDGQRHLGAGADTTLVNVRRRDTPLDNVQAHSFQIGNVHPVAMIAGDRAQAWAVRRLAPIEAGSRSVTLRESVRPASVAPGDIVLIRSDNPPTLAGQGLIYDFQMWNRVTAWDPDGATLRLELPVPRDIAGSSSSGTDLAGPRLCLNAGSDQFLRQPWSVVRDVEIGFLRLESAGLSARNGVWRGWFHDLVLDSEHMVTFNALVLSTVERVTGTWSARMIEIKHSSHDSVVREVTGAYRAMPGVSVRPAVSIGEQSFDCSFDGIDCTIGPSCRDPVRALELSSPGLSFRGTLRHYGAASVGQVWAVKSSDSPANPPAGLDLDLVVRTGGGFAAYGVIGNHTPRPSFPSDLRLRLDQQSDTDPPRAAVQVLGGSRIRVVENVGDATCALVGGMAEPPEGMDRCR